MTPQNSCVELAEKVRDELGCVGIAVDAEPDAVEFYRRYGFTTFQAGEGALQERPRPSLMFLPLGAVPRKA